MTDGGAHGRKREWALLSVLRSVRALGSRRIRAIGPGHMAKSATTVVFGDCLRALRPRPKVTYAHVPAPQHPGVGTGSESSAGQSRWSVRRWVWMSGMASIAHVRFSGASTRCPPESLGLTTSAPQSPSAPAASHLPTIPASTTTTTTAPVPAPAPSSGLRSSAAPASRPLPLYRPRPGCTRRPSLPTYGHATAWGCTATLAYLQAYAAPGFALNPPGYAEGHEAMTCLHGTPQYPDACLNGPEIAISDACPQAYMNQSANSWLLTGQTATEQAKFGASYSSIDPFGACP